MTNFLQNLDFPCNSINIGLVLDLVLLQNFDSHFLGSYRVNAQLDLAKSTFSQRLIN